MNTTAKGFKNAKNCYTCQFWAGKSYVSVTSVNGVEYDRKLLCVCNLTGVKKGPWQSCGDHEKRYDF